MKSMDMPGSRDAGSRMAAKRSPLSELMRDFAAGAVTGLPPRSEAPHAG